jgi:hypothetical protein
MPAELGFVVVVRLTAGNSSVRLSCCVSSLGRGAILLLC